MPGVSPRSVNAPSASVAVAASPPVSSNAGALDPVSVGVGGNVPADLARYLGGGRACDGADERE